MSETLVGAIATKVSRALNLSKPNAQLARELIREATKAKDFADFAVWASQYNVTNDTLQRQIYHQVKATEAAARDEQQRLKAGIKVDDTVKVEVPRPPRPRPPSSHPNHLDHPPFSCIYIFICNLCRCRLCVEFNGSFLSSLPLSHSLLPAFSPLTSFHCLSLNSDSLTSCIIVLLVGFLDGNRSDERADRGGWSLHPPRRRAEANVLLFLPFTLKIVEFS